MYSFVVDKTEAAYLLSILEKALYTDGTLQNRSDELIAVYSIQYTVYIELGCS